MTMDTVLDGRPTAAPREEPADRVAAAFDPSPAMRWLFAALSCGAGAIHLAMVPQHAPASLLMGLAFAAAGWLQIACGVAVVARPRREWLYVAIAANVALVAVWLWSRTIGLPAWTGDGGVEPASMVDGFCVALEVGAVLVAAVVLVAPNALRGMKRPALAVAAIVAVGVLVATTAVLASPGAANHGHGGSETATPGGVVEAGSPGHNHATPTTAGGGAPTTAAGTHADHPAAGAPPGHSHSVNQDDGSDARHHGESSISYAELPADTKAEVDQVIAKWAHKYPTGADAAKDGWFKATPNLYGIGAHYIKNVKGFSVAEPFDLLNPNILLYDGEGPDAKFAGLSYVVAGDVEGYTGSHDFWHAHESICMKDGKISLTEEGSKYWYSEAECTTNGGRVMPIAADKMIHVWIGPGYTDAPIFAHDNPEIYDGYYPKQPA